MKFFVVFALCVAAATANVISPIVVSDEAAEIQQIIDAINHPSTDPATAALLEQMLNEVLGLTKPEPIDVGPAIVEDEYESISVGPAIVNPEINNSPLVQIVINVKPGSGNPVVVEGMPEVAPTPVIVVENPVAPDPVIVAPVIIPEPVITLPDILN
ncbi:uncharacterized protein LOC113403249 [Vanessa tameamea]|uniref:Uncharacterized protein LOC113403249 n=1 Tax=Vanessa tameamea TaxID=334116 RepID=A0ABM4AR84_VANTA